MGDDLYPNSSEYFLPREPEEQIIDRKKERAQTLESEIILNDLIDHLDKRAEFYNSLTSIPDEVRLDPKEFLIMHNTHTLLAKILVSEKEYIEGLLDISKRKVVS